MDMQEQQYLQRNVGITIDDMQGELAMVAGLVYWAAMDYLKLKPTTREWDSAKHYLFGGQTDFFFCFDNAALMLGFDADQARSKLRHMRGRGKHAN